MNEWKFFEIISMILVLKFLKSILTMQSDWYFFSTTLAKLILCLKILGGFIFWIKSLPPLMISLSSPYLSRLLFSWYSPISSISFSLTIKLRWGFFCTFESILKTFSLVSNNVYTMFFNHSILNILILLTSPYQIWLLLTLYNSIYISLIPSHWPTPYTDLVTCLDISTPCSDRVK